MPVVDDDVPLTDADKQQVEDEVQRQLVEMGFAPDEYDPGIAYAAGEVFVVEGLSIPRNDMAINWHTRHTLLHRGHTANISDFLEALKMPCDLIVSDMGDPQRGWYVFFYVEDEREYIVGVLLCDTAKGEEVPAVLQAEYGLRVRLRWRS